MLNTIRDFKLFIKKSRTLSWLGVLGVIGLITVFSWILIVDTTLNNTNKLKGVPLLVKAIGSQRIIEARLSGGFAYGQVDPTLSKVYRAYNQGKKSYINVYELYPPGKKSIEIAQALADIFSEAAYNLSPESQGNLAVAKLLTGDTNLAITNLQMAISNSPQNSQLRNNLAVAYLVKAETEDKLDNLLNALNTIDVATNINSFFVEAQFNRALILEKLCLLQNAKTAWQTYLRIETDPQWLLEGKKHIDTIDTLLSSTWKQEYERFKQESLNNNENATNEFVRRFPHLSYLYALDDLLPEWANAYVRGDYTKANHCLQLTQFIGKGLMDVQKDRLVYDLTYFINKELKKGVSNKRVYTLIKAYSNYKYGGTKLKTHEPRLALKYLNEAKKGFLTVGDIAGETLMNLKIANIYSELSDYKIALESFNRVNYAAKEKNYINILGETQVSLCKIYSLQFDLTKALKLGQKALIYFETTDNTEGMVKSHFMIANDLSLSGDIKNSRNHLQEALVLSNNLDPLLSYRYLILGAIGSVIAQQDKAQESLYFFNEEIEYLFQNKDFMLLTNAFIQRSLAYFKLGQHESAMLDLNKAKNYLNMVEDITVKSMCSKYVARVEAIYKVDFDPKDAVKMLTTVIEDNSYVNRGNLEQIYLARARAYLALGDNLSAKSDLKTSINESERIRSNIEDQQRRISFFEKPQSIYEEMIKLETKLNNTEMAFNYAEKARARTLLDIIDGHGFVSSSNTSSDLVFSGAAENLNVTKIQQILPKDVALIEYSILPEQIFIWVLTKENIRSVNIPIQSKLIDNLSNNLVIAFNKNSHDILKASQSLFSIIFQPVIPLLTDKSRLVVVPDKSLFKIPFAALMNPDTGRYLIEDYAVAVTPSANVYVRGLKRNKELAKHLPNNILVIGNPSFDVSEHPNLSSLPFAETEAKEIAALYPDHQLLLRNSATKSSFLNLSKNFSIIHFAGHGIVDDGNPMDSKLILATTPKENDGTLSAKDLLGLELNAELVVLSACRTASINNIGRESVSNIVYPFLADRVPTVVAVLWNINDEVAKTVFTSFYKHLTNAHIPMDALRATQLEMIRSYDKRKSSPATWGGFVVYGGGLSSP